MSDQPDDRKFAADLFNPPTNDTDETADPSDLKQGNVVPREATGHDRPDPDAELRDFASRLFGTDPNTTGAPAA